MCKIYSNIIFAQLLEIKIPKFLKKRGLHQLEDTTSHILIWDTFAITIKHVGITSAAFLIHCTNSTCVWDVELLLTGGDFEL